MDVQNNDSGTESRKDNRGAEHETDHVEHLEKGSKLFILFFF